MRIKPHAVNDSKCFVAGWYVEDDSLFDDIIKHHESNPTKHEGKMWMAESQSGVVDHSLKRSDDSYFTDVNLAKRYVAQLQQVLESYITEYPYSNKYAAFNIKEHFRIQHYEPNGGFFKWHTERSNNKDPYSSRHLVFMTYLNDVTDGGETEFYHQGIKIKPEKGLTLIWPADWTFTHRGVASPTQEKYIVTGWYSYTN